MAREKLTEDDFNAMEPFYSHLSGDTVKTARKVLVKGRRQKDVAAEHDWSPQRVQAMLVRFNNAINAYPAHWRRVTVWLPPGDAKEVRALAKKRRKEIEK